MNTAILSLHQELNSYIESRRESSGQEGHSGQVDAATERLQELVQQLGASKKILEIGFNSGHSACTMLSAHKDVTVTSFDLGYHYSLYYLDENTKGHDYGKYAHEFINGRFPGKLKLILGDSKKTIPEFSKDNPKEKFDLIFIDGDHSYEGAKTDIENCKQLAHKDTIVILDDYVGPPWRFSSLVNAPWAKEKLEPSKVCLGHNNGPNKAWSEAIREGVIQHTGNEIYRAGRGFAWGRYIL